MQAARRIVEISAGFVDAKALTSPVRLALKMQFFGKRS
jgi:hypothetical protein